MDMICIACPNGCHLDVAQTARGLVITGNKCPKGEAYGRQEATDPRRVVTAVVRACSTEWPCIPVKTDAPLPKQMVPALLAALNTLLVQVPVKRGDPVLRDFEGTGISVVCTRTIPPVKLVKPGAVP